MVVFLAQLDLLVHQDLMEALELQDHLETLDKMDRVVEEVNNSSFFGLPYYKTRKFCRCTWTGWSSWSSGA